MFYKKLKGERLYLSPMDTTEYKKYTEWMNTERVTIGLSNFTKIYTEELQKKAMEGFITEQKAFAIVKNDDTLIGNCGLFGFDNVARSCVLGIFIGDTNQRGKGYGKEAMALLLDFAFNFLNMHSVRLEVFEYNKLALNSYLSLGFKKTGRIRDKVFVNGNYYDAITMDILVEEFKKSDYNNCIQLELDDMEV